MVSWSAHSNYPYERRTLYKSTVLEYKDKIMYHWHFHGQKTDLLTSLSLEYLSFITMLTLFSKISQFHANSEISFATDVKTAAILMHLWKVIKIEPKVDNHLANLEPPT